MFEMSNKHRPYNDSNSKTEYVLYIHLNKKIENSIKKRWNFVIFGDLINECFTLRDFYYVYIEKFSVLVTCSVNQNSKTKRKTKIYIYLNFKNICRNVDVSFVLRLFNISDVQNVSTSCILAVTVCAKMLLGSTHTLVPNVRTPVGTPQ